MHRAFFVLHTIIVKILPQIDMVRRRRSQYSGRSKRLVSTSEKCKDDNIRLSLSITCEKNAKAVSAPLRKPFGRVKSSTRFYLHTRFFPPSDRDCLRATQIPFLYCRPCAITHVSICHLVACLDNFIDGAASDVQLCDVCLGRMNSAKSSK